MIHLFIPSLPNIKIKESEAWALRAERSERGEGNGNLSIKWD